MRVLLGDRWQDGFLDHHRADPDYRLRVEAMATLGPVDGLYFVRPASVRLLRNYLEELGPAAVLRKVLSRRRERHRNAKFVGIGCGRVLEGPAQGPFEPGARVVFLAPAHPACLERVVAPPALLAELDEGAVPAPPPATLLWLGPAAAPELLAELEAVPDLIGWSAYSGIRLEPARLRAVLQRVRATLAGLDWSGARRLAVTPAARPAERRRGTAPEAAGQRALLFGFGNYAKTVTLAYLPAAIRLAAIHEIDPLQRGGFADRCWDTAPGPRPDEAAEVWLIAGFHHTHAPLAVAALGRGAIAVVEKPLVVDRAQLAALGHALQAAPGRLFACFQRRYSPLTALVRADLALTDGDPVSYHCIVYAVPLPPRHWYRWPNAKSRLVSNACHWLDHFLHFNAYRTPVAHAVHPAADGTLVVVVELENGALFSMTLTDRGAERIGIQDHVELRANGRTVTITNDSHYLAEDGSRVLRRLRSRRLRSYARMYRTIGAAILNGEPGDSLRSVEVLNGLMLDLEDALMTARANRNTHPPKPTSSPTSSR